MIHAAFHSVIDPVWEAKEPLRLGQVSSGQKTADRFVLVELSQGRFLRIDLFRSNEESYAFEDVLVWCGKIVIGWGHHVYDVDLQSRDVIARCLDSYFGHMYPIDEVMLVTSAESLSCFAPDGSLAWQSDMLGVDGVVVEEIRDGIVRGKGECDPPGAWRSFTVDLKTGRILKTEEET